MDLTHDYVRRANFTTNSRLGILLNSLLFLGIHLFKLSQIYNFKTRLGEICSSDVNAKGYYHCPLTLQPLKYIPLVAIDRRENSCGIFYHYYFTWIDTRLIKHINLPGLALSQGQLTKIKKFPIYALTLPPWLQNKVEISLHNYERSNLAGVVSNKQNDSLVESNCLAFFWILL